MNCVNAVFAGCKMEVSHCRQNRYWLFETVLYNTLRKYFKDVFWQETASLATIMYQLSPSNQSLKKFRKVSTDYWMFKNIYCNIIFYLQKN
jgi:hypothetical protein